MPFTIGIDMGLATVKGVAMGHNEVVAQIARPSGARPGEVAESCFRSLLAETGVDADALDGCVATGWASKRVPLSFEPAYCSEIVCLSRGARWACATATTAVDIGAQIVKAVRVSPSGKPKRYELSDKCASGSGRFLEIMAKALGLEVESLAEVGASAREKVLISSQCSVFAESEIVSFVNTGAEVPHIVNGVNYSIAQRVATIALRVEVQPDLLITGGVAKNTEVTRYLEEMLSMKAAGCAIDPQIVCAAGAALVATRA
jgi:predicted CoA-substrate-specific enzyme activase